MKKYLVLAILYFIPYGLCFGQNKIYSYKNTDTIFMMAYLKPKENIDIIYDNEGNISFRNGGLQDSVILKKVYATKSMEFRYGLGYREGNGFKVIGHKFYLNPGDTILLTRKNQYDIQGSASGKMVFLDEALKPYKEILIAYSNFASINQAVHTTHDTLSENKRLIDSLLHRQAISAKMAANWEKANEIEFYAQLIKIVNLQKFEVPVDLLTKIDGLIYRFKFFQSVRANSVKELMTNFISYDIERHKKNPINIIENVNYIINNAELLGSLSSELLSDWIKNYPQKNDKNFQVALTKVLAYMKKKAPINYSILIKNENYHLPDLSGIFLKNDKGNIEDLKKIFKDGGTKLFLVDMWASWCVPCRIQMPSFQKHAKEFSGKNIRFMSISIDQSEQDWMKALREKKTFSQVSEFLLRDYKNSPLTKFFGIDTVPRYLIISADGRVINDRFSLPTDSNFKNDLLRLISLNE